MNEVLKLLTSLSPEKRALLVTHLKGRNLGIEKIPRRADRSRAPLSFAQRRLWFLDRYETKNPYYNVHATFRLYGDLNVAALEQSFNEIVKRHETLRTVFPSLDGTTEQHILMAKRLQVRVDDLSSVAKPETQLFERVYDEIRRPFDLEDGPLLRVRLLRLSQSDQVLVVTTHHIIFDGWSLGVLVRELSHFYRHFAAGAALKVEELPIQYGDFAAYQAGQLERGAFDKHLAYWQQQLAGAPKMLELPADHPRPATLSFRGHCCELLLPASLSDHLKEFSQQQNSTLFITLLTAYYFVLRSYSGSEDICIGTPVSGREHGETHGLIGFFINTVVLRLAALDSSFAAAMDQVRRVVTDAFAHQDIPFERVVDVVEPERDPSRTPLFQTIFALQNAEAPELELPGLTVVQTEQHTGTTKFDLTFIAKEEADGIRLVMEYATDLFEASTIERMLRHYLTFLENVSADWSQTLAPALLISSGEREQLAEWNETAREFPREGSIAERFELQVRQRGDAEAVVYGTERLSYRELNGRANQLAHYLKEQGVGADVVVGVCQERSVDLIVSLLGILKAGGAYLPLDPAYPPGRREYMAAQAGSKLVLSELPPGLGARSTANLERQSGGDNLAYVMFTSGSTGRPKGVCITHANVLHLVHEPCHVRIGPGDVAVQASTASFDAATFEIWSALLNGARLVGVSQEELLSAEEFAAKLGAEGVTVLFLATALFNALARQVAPALAAVPQVLFGGEQVDARSVATVQAAGVRRLVNLYGPTEVTVCASWHEVQEVASPEVTVPIGRPINNMEVHVLDERGQLLPVGVVGELYAGGAGLARGYVGDAAQTAERFVPHPFAKNAGERLFRTGDLVRRLGDGELEFVGRVDEQVKLRGYRIEPGEIEHALREHEAVQDAVVVVRSGEDEEKRLIAYVVAEAAQASVSELRGHLRERLPEYMVPWSYEYLERLPRKVNGKVDREALPEPAGVAELSGEYVGPRTATEEVLCGIWSEVLRVERVGIHDNFFELGGDSILSIQISARARQRGLHLSPKQLFQQQWISDLAALVTEVEPVQAAQGLVVGEVGLTPIQHWFFEQETPEPQHWNQALVLESREQLDEELLQRTWRELMKHHDGLRSRFRRSADGWRQEIAAPSESDVEFASYDLRGLSRAEQRERLEASGNEQQRSLDLERGPLVRVCRYQLDETRNWLLIVIHHLVVDGVSWRILLEDMQQVYEQLRRGEAVVLPAKSSSLVQWSCELQEYAHSSVVLAEAEYWLRAGVQSVPRLPRDYANGENTAGSVAQETASLSEAETQALLQEVPGRYQTEITEVLVAALAETLWRWSGERLVRIALEGHGREEIGEAVEVTRTVGWFTSLYPALIDLRRVYEVGAMLQAVKEQLRSIPRRGIGYGLLRYLGEEVGQRLPAQPEAELSFNYLGQFDQVLGGERWLRATAEQGGAVRDASGQRRHLLDVSSSVVGGQLHVTVQYSRAVHREERMAWLMNEYVGQLRRIIEHCRKQDRASYTPSDFPQAQLSRSELEGLLVEIGEGNK